MASWPYNTTAWRKLRAHVLRQAPLCRLCAGRGLAVPAVDVDHITPVADGGAPFDQNNLQALCHSCHSRKTRADQTGKPMAGCDEDGTPHDARHWWR